MKLSVCYISLALLLSLSVKAELVPLEVYSKEHSMDLIRQAVKGGFQDVLESPVIEEKYDYMKVLLVPNGFVTLVELHCDITFRESVKGLMIIAVPYDAKTGQKVEVEDFATRKGIYMMIEGAALECDYEIESLPQITPDMGGFLSYNDEILRVTEVLGKFAQEPVVSWAEYPTTGRVYQCSSQNGSVLVQIEEDPVNKNTTARLWLVVEVPGEGLDSDSTKVVKEWLEDIRKYLMGKQGPKMYKTFLKKGSESYSTDEFDAMISVEETRRSFLLQESPDFLAVKMIGPGK